MKREFGPETEETSGGCRKMRDEKLHNLH